MKKILLLLTMFFMGITVIAAENNEWVVNCLSSKQCIEMCKYDVTYSERAGNEYVNKNSEIYLYYYLNDSTSTQGKFAIYSPVLTKRLGPEFFSYFFEQPIHFISTFYEFSGGEKPRDFFTFKCPLNIVVNDWAPKNKTTHVCLADDLSKCGDLGYSLKEELGVGNRSIQSPKTGSLVSSHEIDYFRPALVSIIRPNVQLEANDYAIKNSALVKMPLSEAKQKEIVKTIFNSAIDSLVLETQKKYKTTYLNKINNDNYSGFFRYWIRDYFLSAESKNLIDAYLMAEIANLERLKEIGRPASNMEEKIIVYKMILEDKDTLQYHIDDFLKGSFGKLKLIDTVQTCDSIFGSPDNIKAPAYWIQLFLNIIRIGGISALLLMSSMDFFKAVVAQDNDAIKKASSTALKRFLYTIILFFLPILVKTLFTSIDWYEDIKICENIK